MARRKHRYYVYVVVLDDKVWNEARFAVRIRITGSTSRACMWG